MRKYAKLTAFDAAIVDKWVEEHCEAAPCVMTLSQDLWREFKASQHPRFNLFGPILFAEYLTKTYPTTYQRNRRYLRGIRLKA